MIQSDEKWRDGLCWKLKISLGCQVGSVYIGNLNLLNDIYKLDPAKIMTITYSIADYVKLNLAFPFPILNFTYWHHE